MAWLAAFLSVLTVVGILGAVRHRQAIQGALRTIPNELTRDLPEPSDPWIYRVASAFLLGMLQLIRPRAAATAVIGTGIGDLIDRTLSSDMAPGAQADRIDAIIDAALAHYRNRDRDTVRACEAHWRTIASQLRAGRW